MAGEKDAKKSETPQQRAVPVPVVRPPDEVKPQEDKPPVDPKSAPTPPEPAVTAPPEEKPQEAPPEKAKPEEIDPDGLLKKIEEAKREEEKKKKEEEEKKKTEEAKKKAEEKKKLAEEKRKAEDQRLAKQAEKFDADKISNLLNKQDGAQKPAAQQGEQKDASLGAREGTGKRLAMSQTAMLVGMIQDQIAPCWSPPLNASAASTSLIVKIDISFNRDGSLNGRPQIINSNSDPVFRPMADSAVRAIVRCAPLKLPADMYEGEGGWKDLTFNFDPSSILQ